ncbi:hypothetical protein VPH35_109594 [Triticum aestivum]
MYSMPNGAQEQVEEGEVSGGESEQEWQSDGEGEEDDDGSSEEEEEEVDPPRMERRSKLTHDPASERGKATAPVGAATSETSATNGDQEMEDDATSNLVPPHVIDLPDDDDEAPLRPRRNRKVPAAKTTQIASVPEAPLQDGGNITWNFVSFAVPLTSVRPSSSTADPPSLFATHHVPEDQVGAAKEAIRQVGIMMEQIQLDLDLKLVQENFKKAKDEAKDKMKEALKKKDHDLAEAQKAVLDKMKLAEEKLASVGKLEEENANLKAALDAANKEVSRLKNGKIALNDKASELVGKKNDLEAYLGGLAKKLFIMLEEFCQNFKEETSRVETSLGPTNSLVKDEAAMDVLRLESRVAGVVYYLARLKVAASRIDTTVWPGATLQNDLESVMTRLNEVPGRVQEWKKSSARCGADVALSLVRVHCKDA